MIQYEIKVDREQLNEATSLFEFMGGNSADAIRIAINKTGPKVKTLTSAKIREQVRLKAGYVGERLSFDRATRSNLVGKITTPSRGLLLSRFSTDAQIASDKISWIYPPDEPPRGIRVKVKPSGSTEVVTGGSDVQGQPFYMVLRNSGALGIAARRVNAGPQGGKIKVFYGPSLSQVMQGNLDELQPKAGDEFQVQILDAMRYLLAKQYPPEA